MATTVVGAVTRRPREEEVDHPLFAPTLPRVNLLPASVAESYTKRRIRRAFLAIALLVIAAFAVIWYLQNGQVAAAQARLARAEADNATVAARVEALAPMKQMYEQITGEQDLVATTLASEPRAALVISRLVDAGRAGAARAAEIAFTTIAIEYRGVPEPGAVLNPCPNPDPFGSEITIGCVTFSGTAATRAQVSRMLSTIAADSLFVGPYVNNSTVTMESGDVPGGVMFTGTVGISLGALDTSLTNEQLDAILHPPTPAVDGAGTTEPAGQ